MPLDNPKVVSLEAMPLDDKGKIIDFDEVLAKRGPREHRIRRARADVIDIDDARVERDLPSRYDDIEPEFGAPLLVLWLQEEQLAKEAEGASETEED